jgi:hypothetical protein
MSDEELAKAVAYKVGVQSWATYPGHGHKCVADALAAVRAEEREACAKVAYDEVAKWDCGSPGVVAAAIRGRGEMSQPSVEEIVAKWESAPWDEEQLEELRALIADWRKRGDAGMNSIYIVIDPSHETTPVSGAWTTLEGASDNCPEGYAILKLETDRVH